MTAAEIAAAVGGSLISGDLNRTVSGFSIDSRTLAEGDLFFAIRGERFDGHAFVSDVLVGGASGVVVSDRSAVTTVATPQPFVLLVADTTRALQSLARHVRRQSGAKV